MSHQELESLVLTRRWHLGKQHDLHDLADTLLTTESIVPTLRSLSRHELQSLALGLAGEHAQKILLADESGVPFSEVAALLPALLEQPTPVESAPDGASASIALHSVVALRDLIEWVASEPITMGATGGLLRAEEKILAAGLVVSEDDAVALVRIAEVAGLVRTIDRRLYATTRGVSLSDDLVALWTAAFDAIVSAFGPSVRDACASAGRLDEPFLEWLLPLRDTHESAILHRVASESRLFGVTAGGTTELGRIAVAGVESIPAFLEPLLPGLQTSVYVLDDLSIIAPGPVTTETSRFLSLISSLETRGLAPKRRLDPALILRAIASGTTVESIIARLSELSLTPVSAAVTSTIADIANNGRFITLNGTGTDTAAKASHPELGEMLLSDPRLQRLAPVKVDDLSVLYGASRLRVETALVENRYTVVAPTTEPTIVEPRVPTALLELAENLFATGLGSTHLERALITAGKTRSKVTLLVETSTGNKTITLEPRHVANGRVRGLDTVADVERTLPISAIIELVAVGE
jgi:hypothetical protein